MPITAIGSIPISIGTYNPPVAGETVSTILAAPQPTNVYGNDTLTIQSITPVTPPPPVEPPPVGEQPPSQGENGNSFFDKIKGTIKNILPDFSEFSVSSVLKGAGIGAAVGGVVSAVKNGIMVLNGKTKSSYAVGKVVGDVVSGAVSGIGFATFSSLAIMGLGAFGLAGLPLTILGIAAGAIGALIISKVFTPAQQWISDKVSSMLGYKKEELPPVSL